MYSNIAVKADEFSSAFTNIINPIGTRNANCQQKTILTPLAWQ
jgi:hypothetical protein